MPFMVIVGRRLFIGDETDLAFDVSLVPTMNDTITGLLAFIGSGIVALLQHAAACSQTVDKHSAMPVTLTLASSQCALSVPSERSPQTDLWRPGCAGG